MQIQRLIRQRLADALGAISSDAVDLADMVRPTQDPALGDFQINSAMPLAKRIRANPRDIAARIVEKLMLDDLCESVEIAGPGFVNLRLRQSWISSAAAAMLRSPRLGVPLAEDPKRIIVDYSSPNVAKPMHVGHIRSTVIGDALAHIMRFLGHDVITDNHLGDWGTQFGMVIYGYRNFLDADAFRREPVAELLRIYRVVNGLVEYRKAIAALPGARSELAKARELVAREAALLAGAPREKAKELAKAAGAAERRAKSAADAVRAIEDRIAAVENDSTTRADANQHADIADAVLDETAKLHAGDAGNIALWQQLLPYCMDEINRVYRRLNVRFDYTLGESFYHNMLADVVQRLKHAGVATESDGAICLFLDGYDAPMIIQKQDGAFLYATTDLATLRYRQETFQPDEILYVVDFRQAEHFKKLFAAATLMGIGNVKLVHVSFGTVLDASGRPIKTRSGTLAGLEGLLDDAVARAYQTVCASEQAERLDPPLSDAEKRDIAECVGIGAIKYADLAHHRTSDYKFSLEKMVSLDGNTAAYVQYAYARVQGILRAAELGEQEVLAMAECVSGTEPAERALLLSLLRYEEVLCQVREEYAPNLLVDFLYEIAKGLASMYEQCPIVKAPDAATRRSRLGIATLAGMTLRHGLGLLGIGVVPRM